MQLLLSSQHAFAPRPRDGLGHSWRGRSCIFLQGSSFPGNHLCSGAMGACTHESLNPSNAEPPVPTNALYGAAKVSDSSSYCSRTVEENESSMGYRVLRTFVDVEIPEAVEMTPRPSSCDGRLCADFNIKAKCKGHPVLCSPCRFFSRGHCSRDRGCDLCHAPHRRIEVEFGSKDRALLARCSEAQVLNLLWPEVVEKVRTWIGGAKARKIILFFAFRPWANLPEANPVPKVNIRTLSESSLGTTLRWACRYLPAEPAARLRQLFEEMWRSA